MVHQLRDVVKFARVVLATEVACLYVILQIAQKDKLAKFLSCFGSRAMKSGGERLAIHTMHYSLAPQPNRSGTGVSDVVFASSRCLRRSAKI